MSEKLYLIRVDMERFIGPITLKEVRESYCRMEFGLQDEIAASNRAWVAFDDLERVRRHYPELVGLIKKEMLSGWGTTSPSSIRIRRVSEDNSMSRKTVGLFTKISILLAVSFISFVMFYLIRENKFGDLGMIFKDPLLTQAMFHYSDDYNVRFEAFMDRSRDDINDAIKSRNQLEAWLPFVRSVAYHRDGTWPGLPARSLRGKDVEFSPADCSLASWRKRWEASSGQWQSMLAGNSFPAADWSRILVWDTDWIRSRRTQEKQWFNPGSYYEACMNMALKALDEFTQARDRIEAEVFRSRLRWKLNLLRGNSLESQFQMSGSLWVLSCIESADHNDEIRNCLNSMKLGREWTRYLDARGSLRLARNLISENSVLNREQVDQLRGLIDKIPTIDQFSRFDYSEEKKLFQTVIEKSGHVSAAIQSVNQQNQTFRFDY